MKISQLLLVVITRPRGIVVLNLCHILFDALVDFNKIWRDTGTVGNSSSKKGISVLDGLLVSLPERVRNVQQQLKLKDEFTPNFLSGRLSILYPSNDQVNSPQPLSLIGWADQSRLRWWKRSRGWTDLASGFPG